MEYSPPPLFKQGAPARVKVTVFALISVALLVFDARVHALAVARQIAGTVLYPLQVVALMPRDAIASMGDYFSSLSEMQREVRQLKQQQLVTAQALQQAQVQVNENAYLRQLLDAKAHVPVKSLLSEILYDARDAASRKIVLDRGSREHVALGMPVIDNAGVVGQITRVFPFTSEATLLTDREQAIPVQVLRNGLRSVAYGRGQSGQLDLRFVAPNADVQVGDVLITSGLDGVYPAGLAVARVVQVETAAGAFGRVVCQPLAGIDRHRQLLILTEQQQRVPRPADEQERAVTPARTRAPLPKMDPIDVPPLAPAPVPPAGKSVAGPALRGAVKGVGTEVPAAAPAAHPAQHRAIDPAAPAATPAATPAAPTKAAPAAPRAAVGAPGKRP